MIVTRPTFTLHKSESKNTFKNSGLQFVYKILIFDLEKNIQLWKSQILMKKA